MIVDFFFSLAVADVFVFINICHCATRIWRGNGDGDGWKAMEVGVVVPPTNYTYFRPTILNVLLSLYFSIMRGAGERERVETCSVVGRDGDKWVTLNQSGFNP